MAHVLPGYPRLVALPAVNTWYSPVSVVAEVLPLVAEVLPLLAEVLPVLAEVLPRVRFHGSIVL